jgi:DNA-binding helix-hairpin-helix protein with protein kinase domain
MMTMTSWQLKTQNGGDTFTVDDSLFLNRGTEGAIHQVPGDDALVVKIYSDKVEDERVNKLTAMVANPPDDPMSGKGHASIAWPKDLVILSGTGEVCGFVMPRLRAVHPISTFYNLKSRRAELPFFTYKSLCRLGSNLASAVWALHDKGYVIGDVNEGNIMATAGALAAIVDTDSFQIKDASTGHVYRCPVYTPFYTAPEIQEVQLDQVDRAPEHDLFGIAVVLFQLLMEGNLPFQCAFADPNSAPETLDCLKRGYFPYGQALHGISAPPGAPPYKTLHPELQQLFNLCFIDGYQDPRMRPSAETWRRTLLASENDLTQCAMNSQHYYFNHLNTCHWCEQKQRVEAAKKQGNWDPFPQPGSVSAGPRGQWIGTQRPISAPSLPPSVTPPATQASAPALVTISMNQPVPVALKEISVQLNEPIALHSAELALINTLPLKQPATRLFSPMRLKDHMQLDGYQPLNDVTVELNYA